MILWWSMPSIRTLIRWLRRLLNGRTAIAAWVLMLGIVVDKDERAAMVSQLMEKGVLVLTAGTEAIRLLPPLVITKEEMDEAIAAMREVF